MGLAALSGSNISSGAMLIFSIAAFPSEPSCSAPVLSASVSMSSLVSAHDGLKECVVCFDPIDPHDKDDPGVSLTCDAAR